MSALRILLAVATTSAAAAAQNARQPDKIAFTVRDSVEMTRVLDLSGYDTPGDVAWFSADNDYFVIHTRRGDIAHNSNVEALLLFDTRNVEDSLASRESGAPPAPTTLVQRNIHDDWGAISAVQWLDNGELAFVAEGDNGRKQAFLADVKTGRAAPLTRSDTDVEAFAASGDRIVYYAHAPVRQPPQFNIVDDRSLVDVLFPDNAQETPLELFQTSRSTGTTRRIAVAPVRLNGQFLQIWISPDGAFAVTFALATNAPGGWADYQMPMYARFAYTPERARSDPTSRDLALRTRYQLIDLTTNEAKPLLDAPSGFLAQNRTPPEVYWPKEGRSVIVSNTYLPLEERSPELLAKSRAGPAIVEVDLRTGAVTPITWEPVVTPQIEARKVRLTPIVSLQWDDTANVLTITKQSPEGTTTVEAFRKSHGAWRRVATASPARHGKRPAIERREALNQRPRVYATGGRCGCTKELLDPNPTADRLGFARAEVFQWTDRNAITWQGGLLYPPGYSSGRSYPLVVQTHGFDPNAFLIDGPNGAAQALANAGFIVLQAEDNRQAITFDEHEAGRVAEGYRAAIETLVSKGLADSGKVGMVTFSRTGLYAVQLLANHPDLLAAMVIADGPWWGYMNELLSLNRPPDVTSEVRALTGEAPRPADLAEWFSRNPLYKLPHARAAIRLEAHDADGTILGFWEHYALLRGAHRPVEFVYFPYGSHVLQKPADRLASEGGSVDWFRYWLQGEEDADATKAEQYHRWRALRRLQDARDSSRGR